MKVEEEVEVESYHTYISSVAGSGMSAASFSIQSGASSEQKSEYSRKVIEHKEQTDAEKLELALKVKNEKKRAIEEKKKAAKDKKQE